MRHPLVQALRGLLPAPRCVLCAEAATQANLCAQCHSDLPARGPACARCALSLPRGAPVCGACVLRTPAWDAAASAFDYAFPIPQLVRGIKYRGRLDMAVALGRAAASRLATAPLAADALAPIPLHWRRRLRRGFNQALELARPVADRAGVPILPSALVRTRATTAQTALDFEAREANPRGAFAVRTDVRGLRLIVFDDVLTTGATAQAAALALHAAGARSVRVWTCARADLAGRGQKKSRRTAGSSSL